MAGTLPAVPVLLLDEAKKWSGVCEGGVKGTVGKREELFILTSRSERGQNCEREKKK